MTILWIWYRLGCFVFRLRRGICQYYSGFKSIIWTCIQHSEYVSQLGFLPQFATHGLLTVLSALCVVMEMLNKNQLANSLQGWCRDACPKKKPTFLFGRGNTPTFKHYVRLACRILCANITRLTFSRRWLKEWNNEVVLVRSNKSATGRKLMAACKWEYYWNIHFHVKSLGKFSLSE